MPVIPNEVAADIQRWVRITESALLWVEGPAYGSYDEALTSIGNVVWDLSENASIPCIGFFARTNYTFESQLVSTKNAGMISMLYSIISQLIDILPAEFPSIPGMSRVSMGQLDGTMESVSASLGVLQALLSCVEPGLICIICGFELVDARDNYSILTEFVKILREQPLERRIKTLFISAGNCRALGGSIKKWQRSDASRLVLGRHHSPLPGGVVAQNIDIGRES